LNSACVHVDTCRLGASERCVGRWESSVMFWQRQNWLEQLPAC